MSLEILTFDQVPLLSEKQINYRKLRLLLHGKHWKAADQESAHLLFQAMEKPNWISVHTSDLQQFPCTDLQTIDRLWQAASQGHYGFTPQAQIWQECGCPQSHNQGWELFGDRIHWRSNGQWLNYPKLNWRDTDPMITGHLPRCGVRGRGLDGWWAWGLCFCLFSRLLVCQQQPTGAMGQSSNDG